jgi:hypothetical protein
MKAWKLGSLLGLSITALAAGALAHLPARAQGEAVWLTNYEAARAAARQAGKPLFVVLRCER